MLNVSFYIFTMSMLNVSLDKCKVAMEVGLGVVLCFEVLSRMTLHLWTSSELWMSAAGSGPLRGCSVLVCPGAILLVVYLALRGSASSLGRGVSQTEVKSRRVRRR